MSGPGGRGGGRSPHHFRPPSPYAPSPPPRLGGPDYGARPSMPCPRPRWPASIPRAPSPVVNQGPKPFRLPMHPPSPAPMRCASPDYYRGMSPYETSHRILSPISISSPEVSSAGRVEYEFVGVPLEPPPLPQHYDPDEEDSGPSTAEIIANQSQDYVDEKLAEYQATIYQLQDSGDDEL